MDPDQDDAEPKKILAREDQRSEAADEERKERPLKRKNHADVAVNHKKRKLVNRYTDMFQIGARNMQNFNLLSEVGQTNRPVLQSRGGSSARPKCWTGAPTRPAIQPAAKPGSCQLLKG